jgi:predicted acetyltransferase
MMQLQLVLPSMQYQESYRAYIRELGDEVRYPFPLDFEHADFQELLRKLENFSRGKMLPEGFVPSTTYWLVQGQELIGVSNLRHYLNERIRNIGGHVGLGIRPSCRGQGFGKTLLGLTIDEATKRGIGTIHVHCHKHNEPSSRMIKAVGGILDSEIQETSGSVVQRYLVSGS